MKKSLLALMVLGAFSAAASAQTNVTFYGIADASLAKETGSTMRLDSGNLSASRFGFKGVEDLYGGLSAQFLMEGGYNIDNGTAGSAGKIFSRLAYVGLSGNSWGTVRLGRQNSPIKTALDVIDPFKGSGDLAAIDTLANGNGWPERVDNQLTYLTPNWGGFSGSAAYVFGETGNSTRPNRQYGIQLGYGAGPVNVQVSYQNANATAGTGATATNLDTKIAFVGATYDFAVAKLHAGFGNTQFDQRIAGRADTRSRNYLLGLTVPFGANQVIASVNRNDERQGSSNDYTQYGVAFLHDLSKRTTLYAEYAYVRNQGNAEYRVDRAGTNNNRFALGVRHTW